MARLCQYWEIRYHMDDYITIHCRKCDHSIDLSGEFLMDVPSETLRSLLKEFCSDWIDPEDHRDWPLF